MSDVKPAVLAPPNPKLSNYLLTLPGPPNQESREAHDHAREVRQRRESRVAQLLESKFGAVLP